MENLQEVLVHGVGIIGSSIPGKWGCVVSVCVSSVVISSSHIFLLSFVFQRRCFAACCWEKV